MAEDRFNKKYRQLYRSLILMGSTCETLMAKASRVIIHGQMEITASMQQEYDSLIEREEDIFSLAKQLASNETTEAWVQAIQIAQDLKAIGEDAMHMVEGVDAQWGWMDSMDLEELALASIHLVSQSIDSFVQEDQHLAQKVIVSSDAVDTMFERIEKQYIQRWQSKDIQAEEAVERILKAKDFSSMARHARHISQRILIGV